MKHSYRLITIGALIALLFMLAACTSAKPAANPDSSAGDPAPGQKASSSSSGQKEKVIYLGAVNPATTVGQIKNPDADISILPFNDTLLDVNDKFEFLPKLANSIETKDNQTYVIKLNPAAKWNDGQPFSTADIEFTLNTALHPLVDTHFNFNFIQGLNTAGKLDEGVASISGLNVIDAQTIEIKTKTPIAPTLFKETFATKAYFIPKHILKDVPKDQINTHPYFQNPQVTIGPFKFSKFVKGSYIEAVRNENYYLGKPKVDKIIIKQLPAENLIAQLQTGEIHMNLVKGGIIPITDFEKVKSLTNIALTSSEPTEPAELYFNTKRFAEPKVRQAFAHALNRKLIVDQLFKGHADLLDGPVPIGHPNYNSSIKPYGYDPEKAKQLLKEANWDFKQPIRFLIPVGNKNREQAGEILAQNLTEIGLNVQVEKYDLPSLVLKVRKFDYDLAIFNRGFRIDPSAYFSLYKSDDSGNWLQFKNARADELIDRGQIELDPAKRKEIYDQLQVVLHDELPSLSIYSEKRLLAVSKNVLLGKPLRLGMWYNVHEWDLKS
jgi:peptide/nickel transport system substrate-binding protein